MYGYELESDEVEELSLKYLVAELSVAHRELEEAKDNIDNLATSLISAERRATAAEAKTYKATTALRPESVQDINERREAIASMVKHKLGLPEARADEVALGMDTVFIIYSSGDGRGNFKSMQRMLKLQLDEFLQDITEYNETEA